MKKLALFLLLPIAAFGQTSGTIPSTGGGTACVSIAVGSKTSVILVGITGTWTGTLQPKITMQGQTSANVQVIPSTSSIAQATITANGVYSASVNGADTFQVCGNTVGSGTANIYLNNSNVASLNGTGGGSGGPLVLNAQSYGLASGNSDAANNTALTAVFSAANAATTSVLPSVAAPPGISQANTGVTSQTTNVVAITNQTILLFVVDSLQQSFTFTDSGASTNTWTRIGQSPHFGTAGYIQVYATVTGYPITSVTVNTSPAELVDTLAEVLTDTPVANISLGSNNSGSSTSASLTQNTSNAFIAGACSWWNNATINMTPTGGTILENGGATSAIVGALSYTGPTFTGTLSATSPWGCQAVTAMGSTAPYTSPTVYIPAGFYSYNGGIAPTQPMTIQCDPGAWLNYTGSAHAADIGVSGLTSNTQVTTKARYIIDGCTFTGGAVMTEGIYLQPYNQLINIRRSSFINFGNSSSYMIWGQNENWDVEVGPANAFYTYDNVPRNVLHMNGAGASGSFDSFLRFHDNGVFCWNGLAATAGCDQSTAGIGVVVDGYTNRIYHNNMAFFKPLVEVLCTAASTCINNQIDQNQMESPATGTTSTGVIVFNNQDGMLVTQNTILMHVTGASPITPLNGTSTLSGARVNFNTVSQSAAATPVVALNNVANQTGNFSFSNECATSLGVHAPCPLVHTTGGSINNWDTDQYIHLTFNAGTTASYSFLQTYSVAPVCAISPINPSTTTFTITTLSTTTLTVTASGTFTGTVNAICSAGDAL